MLYGHKKIDNENVQRILDSFFAATGIPVSYFDEEFNVITAHNFKHDDKRFKFCNGIQTVPALREGCIQCDMRAIEEVTVKKRFYTYKCHMNLMEGFVPLLVDDCAVGYFVVGKFVEEKKEEETWTIIKKKLMKLRLPESTIQEYFRLYQGIPVIPQEKLEAACALLVYLSSFIVKSDYISLQKANTAEMIKKYIKKNLNQKMLLSDIAEKHNISTPYMCTLFKTMTGMTINAYINQQRLERAKKLLVSTNLSLKEIASEVGYDNQNYFSRVFKKYMQVSASEYRESNSK